MQYLVQIQVYIYVQQYCVKIKIIAERYKSEFLIQNKI